MMDLVTGATGFIGSHVLYHLVRMNRPVRAMYRNLKKIQYTEKIFGYYEKDPSAFMNRVDWVQGDITDYKSVMDILKDVSRVYHVAGQVSFSRRGRKEADLVNVGGTANIVNACMENRVRKLCHVSSVAVLGNGTDSQPIDENIKNHPVSSHSYYGLNKYKGEMEVWRGIHEGLEAVIVNPSLVIGPGMWLSAGAPLLTKVYNGLNFYPGGSCGYVDVNDVADFMIKLAESNISGERFILNAENLEHRDFINMVADAMGRKRPGILVNSTIASLACTAEKIRSVFTGQSPVINRQTMRIAAERTAYSNKKIMDASGKAFTPIRDSVSDTVKVFLKEMEAKTLKG